MGVMLRLRGSARHRQGSFRTHSIHNATIIKVGMQSVPVVTRHFKMRLLVVRFMSSS